MIRLAPAVLLACLLAIAPARAENDSAYDDSAEAEGPDEAQPEPYYGGGTPPVAQPDAVLATHGAWVQHASWGRVWRPRVAVGWRPYTYGYWAWSPYGWTWVSNEPWGSTFHYGRWGWHGGYGWVWVPGTVWAPAWVDWWEADGWIGWAPLGPAGWIGVRERYVFVRDRDFCDRRLRHRVHDYHGVSAFGRHGWSGRRGGPPALHRVERVSRHPLVRVPDPRRGGSLGTHRLPSPSRPGGAHARRDVPQAPVLPRGADDRRGHEGRSQVPRVPDRVEPHRPRGQTFYPGRSGGEVRRDRWERPPGRMEFGGVGRAPQGGRGFDAPVPRHHFRGQGGGGRGRVAPPIVHGAPPSAPAPTTGHRIGPGAGGGRLGRGGGERSGSGRGGERSGRGSGAGRDG